MARERIGIMGGTFNPVHQGHIDMARAAAAQEKLSRVLFLPTGNPPHKREGLVDAEDRYRMAAAAIAQDDVLTPSRLEIDRTGVIYTVDTLTLLREKYPRAQLYFIIGMDTLLELQHWRSYEQVLSMCTFLVCPRQGAASPAESEAERKRLTQLGGSFIYINMPPVNVSSTEIRGALALGHESALLPPAVMEYIRACGFYGVPNQLPMAKDWLPQLWEALSLKRFAHSLCVAFTARRLALLHGLDPVKAEAAGLLHDCAKCLPLPEMQRICREHALTQDTSLLESGNLLHSIAGAYLASSQYHMDDPDVLQAIACHTTGKVGMTELDMAVFLADKIEPSRAPYPSLEQVRAAATLSLPRAMLLSLEGTAKYVKKGGKPLHPASQAVADWLRASGQTTPPHQYKEEHSND